MFLVSSFDPQPNKTFEGWCWSGNDLIVGEAGAAEYRHKNGHAVQPDNDGCYVTAIPREGGWQLGTDSRGLARLYLYRDGGSWAASSSLFHLVAHLRSNGKHLKPRTNLLAPYSSRDSFTSQLTSSDALFEGVELLPSFSRLHVTESGHVQIEDSPAPTPTEDYRSSLTNYLWTWRSRLATLLENDEINLSIDLSGGVDSRTVLSFFMSLRGFSDLNQNIRFASSTTKKDDFKAASRIADFYQFQLNGPRLRRNRSTGASEAIERWKENSLGVYLLVYFESHSIDPLNVQAHGAGGGNFRPEFRGNRIEDKLKAYKNKLPRAAFDEWWRSTVHTMERLERWNSEASPLVLHYREFRNRFHFGHKPHNKLVFTPLNTSLTDPLTDGPSGVPARQLYFDIMESLAPGLKDFPYDRTEKKPSISEVEHATKAPLIDVSPGSVYGETISNQSEAKTHDPYQDWIEETSRCFANIPAHEYLDPTYTTELTEALSEAQKGTRWPSNSREMRGFAHIQAIHFVLDEASTQS